MGKVIRFDNGLRAVVESSNTHSVSVGIWINAGSRKENAQNNGISHFIEHMMFKGTDKLNAFEISKKFEDCGAMINAFTGKDCTCYFFKALSSEIEECFKTLSHIFLESVFPAHELDRERKVIIEEINMQEDSPEDICFDLLAKSIYDGPLSQTIIGPAENILRFDISDINEYMSKHYCPKNIVVSFAGGIDAETAGELVEKHFLPNLRIVDDCVPDIPSKFAIKKTVKIDKYEQSNLMLGFPSLRLNDPLVPVQSILNILLGGGMSSRLFQKIREEMGLAYSVYSTPSVYYCSGSFNICVNYSAQNTGMILDCIKGEIDKLLKNGVTIEEFNRAKTQLKSSMVFSQESSQSQMLAIGKLMLLADEMYDMNKRLKEINAVSLDAVNIFAKNLFLGKTPALSYLGKKPDVEPAW